MRIVPDVEKLLLVFNRNPEDLTFYLLDPEDDAAEWARESNNVMLGADDVSDDHNIFKLLDYLDTNKGKATLVVTPIKDVVIYEVITCGVFL